MFEKTYELPLARNYVRHWGVAEAVRELLQNALDSDSPLEYEMGASSLKITSRNAKLDVKTLLLGSTSKTDAKDKIGSFGEGYKLAMLVLTRENRPVTVLNNEIRWSPQFRPSKQFNGEEVLVIVESKYPAGRGQGVTFIVDDLSQQDKDAIVEGTLQMQQSIGAVVNTSKGQILRSKPGKLYVSGLFVCDTELKHGYNMKPEYLKLERDRQTVDSFDLAWQAKNMWFESGLNEEIAQMMADKAPDMAYADYSTPEIVKEACYQHFQREYPGHLIASTKQELEALIKKGMTKTVFIGGGAYTNAVRAAPSYEHVQAIPQTPTQLLEEWFRAHRGNMRTPAIVAFKGLLAATSEWRMK